MAESMNKLLILTLAGLGAISPLTAALDPLPANAELERLDNGMQVLYLNIPGAPMVGLNVQVGAGSAWESMETGGMSHMLEHLLFNGTEEWTQRELYDQADRLGAYNNANTTRYYTNFMVLLPGDEMQAGMHLQCQMLFHSLIPPDKFEKERGIVLEELAQSGDDPMHMRESLWEDFLFLGSSFELPTLGTRASIRHLDRDDVMAYYKGHYAPNNMLLSVVGGFDLEEARAAVEATYGQEAPQSLPEHQPIGLVLERSRDAVRRAEIAQPRLRMAIPAPDMTHPDYLAAEMLAWAMGDPRDGVLPPLLFMAGLPPLPGLEVRHHAEPGFGRFELEVDVPLGMDATELRDALLEVMAGLSKAALPASAIQMRILDERTAFSQLKEKPHYFGLMQAAQFVHMGFERSLNREAELAELDAQDLSRVAEEWLSDPPAVSLLLLPQRQGGADSARAETLREWRRDRQDAPTLLVEGNRPGDVFALQAIIRGRSIWEGEQAAGGIDLIQRMLLDGTQDQSAAELRERIRAIGAKLTLHDNAAIPYDDHYTSSSHAFLRLECLDEYAAEACSLVVDLLLHPALTEEAFNRRRGEQIQLLGRKDNSARARSSQLMDGILLEGRPGALNPEGSMASIAALSHNDLLKLHGLAYRPANMIFSVMTGRDPVKMADLLDKLCTDESTLIDEEQAEWLNAHSPWFEGLTADQAPVPHLEAQGPLTGSRELTEHLGGEMCAIRLGSRIAIQPGDGAALQLLFSILSDRMAFDLREERGWAYSIGCWASPGETTASLGAYMGTRRENLDAALKGMRGWLKGKGLGKLEQDDLDKARGGLLGRSMMRELASINQAWHLATGELSGNPESRREAVAALRAVTLKDLQRVKKQYLGDHPWITVIVD
jgi:zinc protease